MAQFVRFQTTVWTTIEQAKRGNRDSVETVIKKYSPPLRAYIRNRGLGESDADDILQEVLLRIANEEFLAKADKTKGKFRSVILGVCNNVILKHFERSRAVKRGGEARTLSLDEIRSTRDTEVGLPATVQDDFDKLWFEHLLRLALERLERESDEGKKEHYKVLELRIQGVAYNDIARRLRMTESDVANTLHYAKKKVQQFARELISDYSSSRSEFEDELDLFVKSMRG